jgi:hypothetical protein
MHYIYQKDKRAPHRNIENWRCSFLPLHPFQDEVSLTASPPSFYSLLPSLSLSLIFKGSDKAMNPCFACTRNFSGSYIMNVFICVRFEVLTAVTMKNGVFWDVMSCGSCKNGRFD